MTDRTVRLFNCFVGSAPLSIKVQPEAVIDKQNKLFAKFPEEIKEHLEKHANITILQDMGIGFSFRFD